MRSDRDRQRFKAIGANLAHGHNVHLAALVRTRNRLRPEEPPFLLRNKCFRRPASEPPKTSVPQRNTNETPPRVQAGSLPQSEHGMLPGYSWSRNHHRRHLRKSENPTSGCQLCCLPGAGRNGHMFVLVQT